jgi:hypothetical protein
MVSEAPAEAIRITLLVTIELEVRDLLERALAGRDAPSKG